jgi:hypothetical protein
MSRFDERKLMTADTCGKPIPGEPGAVKVACPVRKGGWGNTVRLCVLPLPYGRKTYGKDSPCHVISCIPGVTHQVYGAATAPNGMRDSRG